MKLIYKLHEMYHKDKVTIDLLNAIEMALSEIKTDVDDVERQRLLNYATWFVDYIENDLGILPQGDYQKRREAVKVKLFTNSKVSIAGAKAILEKFTDGRIDIIYDARGRILTVITEFTMPDVAVRELRRYIPAHILIKYVDYIRTHSELNNIFTHNMLKSFTYNELREKGILK